MLFSFSMPLLIRHLWQLKTVIFLHRCLISAVLLSQLKGQCLCTIKAFYCSKLMCLSLSYPYNLVRQLLVWLQPTKEEYLPGLWLKPLLAQYHNDFRIDYRYSLQTFSTLYKLKRLCFSFNQTLCLSKPKPLCLDS